MGPGRPAREAVPDDPARSRSSGRPGPASPNLASKVADGAQRRDHVEVVNADAMQQYRGMDIGTAKVPPAQRGGTAPPTRRPRRHRDRHRRPLSAGRRRRRRMPSRTAVALPIIVGGSMLYVQSCLMIGRFPATDPAGARGGRTAFAEVGTSALHAELALRDPRQPRRSCPPTARRWCWAWKVIRLTGRPFTASAPASAEPRWNTAIIGLDCRTDVLDDRLATRYRQHVRRRSGRRGPRPGRVAGCATA